MALILTRNRGESVDIYTKDILIRVKHLGHRHGQDQWAIEAPPEFRIDRTEIAERIRAGIPAPPKRIPIK